MDNIDLKKWWAETHGNTPQGRYNDVNIRDTLKMNHSKIITKVLSELKMNIFGYSIMLFVLIGLLIYALLYLDLKLSPNTLMLFSFIGLFFVIRIISKICRLYMMTKTTDNQSLKESILFFRRKLNKIRITDFLAYLIYFYTLAVWLATNYIRDIKGVQHLSWNNQVQLPVLMVVIILLTIPWLIKYQHHQSYKKIYSSINDSVHFLNETS